MKILSFFSLPSEPFSTYLRQNCTDGLSLTATWIDECAPALRDSVMPVATKDKTNR